jgi:predicted helicase
MLIQHVLTEDIFSKVFDQNEFHRKNNIAKLLYELEATFFTGDVKWQTLKRLAPYYTAIHSTAAEVRGHHEKQTFLKVVYQNFYRVYNQKLADRLGVVYTPNEIVRFIVQSADHLCMKHFQKRLIERNVEILEPSAGTGTFVTELIDYFRRSPAKLKQKYNEELHANEVAILPYYVANLNIEATYAGIMNEYAEFPNLCFVDTLDSIEGLGQFGGHQHELFGAISEENYSRIKKQNSKKISVVIGNPPYNANQIRENDNNQNRKYPRIDARIKGTYIKHSDATKTKQYDMYVRFFRWASDRIHDTGIVAFITNRSFLDAGNFDGFRKVVATEFDHIYIIDLGGDWKKSGAASGGNVFGIGTGVAIGFWIRKPTTHGEHRAAIKYLAAPEGTGEDKLAWLSSLNEDGLTFENIAFQEITPKDGFWIDHPDSSFEGLQIASKAMKQASRGVPTDAIFTDYSLGISTNRDEWLYDFDRTALETKVKLLVSHYDEVRPNTKAFPDTIKWSETLKRRKSRDVREKFAAKRIRATLYRPFVEKWLYQSPLFVDRPGLVDTFFPDGRKNCVICFSDTNSRASYCVLATNRPTDLHFGATSDGYQQVARYRYIGSERRDNITDWAVKQFKAHYGDAAGITKDAIFAYVYAVLHDPIYREKYALNLKRSFPRIPFYKDFEKWAGWGRALLDLHLNFEAIEPWPLRRTDREDEKARAAGVTSRVILKAGKEGGLIYLNGETILAGIPAEAWGYKLGSRSALEWVLDQFSEGAYNSALLRDEAKPYRFAPCKRQVIDLLGKITRMSVETQSIVGQMRRLKTR